MPNNNNTSNLFALVDDEDALIRRIPLTAAVNTELAQLFAEQQAALLNDRQPIAFTGSYNVDVGEIFTIADTARHRPSHWQSAHLSGVESQYRNAPHQSAV